MCVCVCCIGVGAQLRMEEGEGLVSRLHLAHSCFGLGHVRI